MNKKKENPMKTTDEKSIQAENNETKTTPFFAQNAKGKSLVIKTHIRAGAGAGEEVVK
jgi:hypothetical protein